MEDVPGTYLTIEAETLSLSATKVIVQDGQLFEIINTTTAKLEPANTGTPCDPDDVTIVVPETNQHQRWSKHRRGLKPN
jgi:hypothetical protein